MRWWGVDPHPPDAHEHDPTLDALARALVEVGLAVRAALGAVGGAADRRVVRTEGGDDVFGVDERADAVVLAELDRRCAAWPGHLVMEGYDDPVPVAGGDGPWTYLVDPIDGTRPYLAGKRSAWVLLGAGRDAATLEDLEVGAAVELPTDRAVLAREAWARRGGPPFAVDRDLRTGDEVAVELRPDGTLEHAFVTVARFGPGSHGPIGAWADRLLAGLVVFDDLHPCSGGLLMGVAGGSDAAVLDPRPLLDPGGMAAHPYDLAALVVARAAGVVVEAIPPGPLSVPLDPQTPVAWAAYATPAVAARLRQPPSLE